MTTLLAVWIRGGVAIPGIYGFNSHTTIRNSHILNTAKPELILHDLCPEDEKKLLAQHPDFIMCNIAEYPLDVEMPFNAAPRAGGGLMQFTSGSTSSPKAVLVTHENIAANCTAIASAYSLDSSSVGAHWLPLYHDMGLVGSILMPMWVGCTSVIMRPSIFIQSPLFWFEQIAKRRCTITSAPNFAYQKIARIATTQTIEGLDLSCLETIIIGGEPVHKQTIQLLLDTFESYGLNADALAPSYGLAEATLLVSSGKRIGGPISYNCEGSQPVLSLGSPVKGVCISIVDNAGVECLEGEVGHIHISGECVGTVIPAEENWRSYKNTQPVETGDYGFIVDGEIYITGRAANRIIVRGKNIFSEDVELLVSQTNALIDSDNVAVFGLEVDGSEELCILIEFPKGIESIQIGAINAAVIRSLSIKPAHIVILRRYTLPRTSSGKIQRNIARTQYLAGAFLRKTISYVNQTSH